MTEKRAIPNPKLKSIYVIPMDVAEWPTDDPKKAKEFARATRTKVQAFIEEKGLPAIPTCAMKAWKGTYKSIGDPKVIKQIDDFVSELFTNLVKEQAI